ncbi:hypothetical protein LINPERHAP2_LOCUS36155 [Linum perenne]
MENITASELAGFGVGTLLVFATIAAPKLDALISASQRSSLGMCNRCGDLRMVACSNCKGTGSVKAGILPPSSYSRLVAALKHIVVFFISVVAIDGHLSQPN